MTRLLYKVPGIGKIIASVIAASVPDPSVFKSGRDLVREAEDAPRWRRTSDMTTVSI
jgi:transposase